MDPKELELSLGCHHYSSPCSSNSKWEEQRRPLQQMAIFYSGGMCVSDVTGHQARAIIDMAKKEIMATSAEISGGDFRLPLPAAAAEVTEQQLQNPALCMKRSLQRFLEKRKARMVCYRSSSHGYRQPLQLFSSFR
ncbi:hypothetical protein HPP92_008428 [Vanilla planifolia]|uniref:Protein TIFY n=1 Tax=Vanilla planifolia TaxID=51239 RepID=A0A835R8U3_VANPL|nr:hypothetical protein HPP92_008428 [Vanilla planifolia]